MSSAVVNISRQGHCVLVADAEIADIQEARAKLLAQKKEHEAAARHCGELIAGLTVSLAMIQLSLGDRHGTT